MRKWLSPFLDTTLEKRPDIPDTMLSVSSVSGPDPRKSATKSPSAEFQGLEQAVPDHDIPIEPSAGIPSVPGLYCAKCGGGCWIRVTHDAPLQCGRCLPSETRVETLFFPGGTRPPSSRVSRTGSHTDIIIEPAAPNARPVYWQTGDGRILGPAVPEFFLRDGEGYWISVTFKGHVRFIRDDRLRSRKAFEEQAEIREVEPIRSF